MESSSERQERREVEAWTALLESIRRSAEARVALIASRGKTASLPCPWERLTGCDVSCRCSGTGNVTGVFLRKHYEGLADAIASFVQAAS
jgi:hypothetical protein